MNSTNSEPETDPMKPGVIGYDIIHIIMSVSSYVALAVSLAGVLTNTLNIRTFACMGLNDGVIVTLMGLAISDLGINTCACLQMIAILLDVAERLYNLRISYIHPYIFRMFAGIEGQAFTQVTCWLTTFISIARCLCVAMPFKFKDFFTKSRSALAVVVFNILGQSLFAPLLYHTRTQLLFDPVVNMTRIVLRLPASRSDLKDALFSTSSILTTASCIVVSFCLLVMTKQLRQSVKFRHLSTKAAAVDDVVTKEANEKLSGKELQVVRQVIILCLIYTISTVPAIFIAIYRFFNPDFEIGRRHENSFAFALAISGIVKEVNSASSFFVYYVYNSKFRLSLLSCWTSTGK